MPNIIAVSAILGCYTYLVFFSGAAILGYNHTEDGNSLVYIVFLGFTLLSSFFAYVWASFRYGALKGEYSFYLIFYFIAAIHFLWVILDSDKNPLINEYLKLAVVFIGSGFFSAAAVIKTNSEPDFIRYTWILSYIIVVSFLISLFLPMLSGEVKRSIGGGSYQTLSYMAALIFGIFSYKAYRLTRKSLMSKRWKINSVFVIDNICMLICAATVIIGGGRGAFLLLVVYCLFLFYWLVGFDKKLNISTRFARLFFVCFALAVFIAIFSDNPNVQKGIVRATQFISMDQGIDLAEGASGRDQVYMVALSGIYESPLFGYGPFNVWSQVIHPHNLILEFALQFGVPLVVPIMCLLLFLASLAVKTIGTEREIYFVLSAYPLVMLFFSGSYMLSSVFWFCAASVGLRVFVRK